MSCVYGPSSWCMNVVLFLYRDYIVLMDVELVYIEHALTVHFVRCNQMTIIQIKVFVQTAIANGLWISVTFRKMEGFINNKVFVKTKQII